VFLFSFYHNNSLATTTSPSSYHHRLNLKLTATVKPRTEKTMKNQGQRWWDREQWQWWRQGKLLREATEEDRWEEDGGNKVDGDEDGDDGDTRSETKRREIVVYIAVASKKVGWRRRVGVAGGGVRKRENGGGRKEKGKRERETEWGECFNFFFVFCLFELSLSYWLQLGGVEWYMPRRGVYVSVLLLFHLCISRMHCSCFWGFRWKIFFS